MATKLEILLEKIDPVNTIDKYEKRLNQALNDYRRENNIVESWDEFEEVLVGFFQIASQYGYSVSGITADRKFLSGMALDLLSNEYPRDTRNTVYDIMTSGTEGGVYQIIKVMSRVLAEQLSQRVIGSYVLEYWNSLSVQEQLAAPDEYVQIYQDILPKSIVRNNIRLKIKFWEELEKHPRRIKAIREGR